MADICPIPLPTPEDESNLPNLDANTQGAGQVSKVASTIILTSVPVTLSLITGAITSTPG